MVVAQIRKVLKVQQTKKNDMGYLIFNTDRDDEMSGLRKEMQRNYRSGNYRNYGGSSASMCEHYYRMGYRDSREDMEDEQEEMYRRQRDSRGRYM